MVAAEISTGKAGDGIQLGGEGKISGTLEKRQTSVMRKINNFSPGTILIGIDL